ncbi:uncharacterized protein LOC133068097 [Dama dama]|uniref:uncharacterized protein LOC133068097 n=1 Tax=Dama dama TaxID=30532 RepID=UPI002A35D6F6|nr:uncharacterized protein LOC133068097 [Dama dama]
MSRVELEEPEDKRDKEGAPGDRYQSMAECSPKSAALAAVPLCRIQLWLPLDLWGPCSVIGRHCSGPRPQATNSQRQFGGPAQSLVSTAVSPAHKQPAVRERLERIQPTVVQQWSGGPQVDSEVYQFSSVAQSCPTLCDPMNCSTQASLSITNFRSPPKPMSIVLVMPFNHLILCHPLLLLPSIFPIIRVFSNESALRIRWPKYWSFSFSISPSSEHPGLISFRMD